MAPIANPYASISCTLSRPGLDPEPTAIRLRGDQDLATEIELTSIVSTAIAHDGGPVVMDLSDVQFMSAATVGVIVRAGDDLRRRGRVLTLRSPSSCVTRVFAVCGLTELLELPSLDEASAAQAASALRSWVAVPPTFRIVAAPDPAVATFGLASPDVEPAVEGAATANGLGGT